MAAPAVSAIRRQSALVAPSLRAHGLGGTPSQSSSLFAHSPAIPETPAAIPPDQQSVPHPGSETSSRCRGNFRVIAHHDGDAMLRRLNNIVSAARHQASADKRNVGQRIQRRQLPNCIQQQNSAGQGSPFHAIAARSESTFAPATPPPQEIAPDAAAPESSPLADVAPAHSQMPSTAATLLPPPCCHTPAPARQRSL